MSRDATSRKQSDLIRFDWWRCHLSFQADYGDAPTCCLGCPGGRIAAASLHKCRRDGAFIIGNGNESKCVKVFCNLSHLFILWLDAPPRHETAQEVHADNGRCLKAQHGAARRSIGPCRRSSPPVRLSTLCSRWCWCSSKLLWPETAGETVPFQWFRRTHFRSSSSVVPWPWQPWHCAEHLPCCRHCMPLIYFTFHCKELDKNDPHLVLCLGLQFVVETDTCDCLLFWYKDLKASDSSKAMEGIDTAA